MTRENKLYKQPFIDIALILEILKMIDLDLKTIEELTFKATCFY